MCIAGGCGRKDLGVPPSVVPGDKIIVGNTFKYVIGMAIPVVVDGE